MDPSWCGNVTPLHNLEIQGIRLAGDSPAPTEVDSCSCHSDSVLDVDFPSTFSVHGSGSEQEAEECLEPGREVQDETGLSTACCSTKPFVGVAPQAVTASATVNVQNDSCTMLSSPRNTSPRIQQELASSRACCTLATGCAPATHETFQSASTVNINSMSRTRTLDDLFHFANSHSRKAVKANASTGVRRGTRRTRQLAYAQDEGQQEDSMSIEPPARRALPMRSAIDLRKERRQRDAEFRIGELRAKPPIVHIEASARDGSGVGIRWHVLETLRALDRSPLQVLLPVEPNPAQRVVAQAACDAMASKGCAFLEAPTGTGKTLGVLGTALAWQWAQVQEAKLPCYVPPREESFSIDAPQQSESVREPPRVIWVARTHEQLLHTVSELRRLPYRPMMSLRLSRERFCLLPVVQNARNKAEACEMATMLSAEKVASFGRKGSGRKGKVPPGAGCSYLEHAEAIHYPAAPQHRRRYELGGPLATYDIEDLISEAKALHICPFHAVGDLSMEGAGLILMTYNQLLDPLIRFAGGYEPLLQDAVVAVDEAHNLAGEAREVASFKSTVDELNQLGIQFETLAAQLPGDYPKIAKRLVGAVARLREWLMDPERAGGSGRVAELHSLNVVGTPGARVAGGSDCLALVRHCGLESVEQIDRDIRELKKLRKDLIWAGLESTAVRHRSPTTLHCNCSDDYRLVVKPGPEVHFVCLRGAVALGPAVRSVSSLLLLSGTLSPFDLLAHELGLKGDSVESSTTCFLSANRPRDLVQQCRRSLHVCQASHHANLEQMCIARAVGVVDGVTLDSRFRNRGIAYLDAVGRAIEVFRASIPNGLVVFLPSYALLDSVVGRMRSSGRFAALGAERVFVEERGAEGSKVLASYRSAAAIGSATLLAVMRGKAAEGLDLRDGEARGCLVVGIPYPSLAVEVELRRRAPGGMRWYEAEAMRQVSQAAGRLLRHQRDFGALVLLDIRFAGPLPPAPPQPAPPLLAPWLRRLLRPAGLDDARRDLATFFVGRRTVAASGGG